MRDGKRKNVSSLVIEAFPENVRSSDEVAMIKLNVSTAR